MITFDAGNRLWVADTTNNRVLMFNPPFTNGMNADLVVGQSDFNTQSYGASMNRLRQPQGISFDPSGNLWVADSGNNRVLRYSPPFSDGMGSDLSIGGYSMPPTQKSLNSPSDVKAYPASPIF